jgi:uncharacterized protein YjbI with pentapeptide repeats
VRFHAGQVVDCGSKLVANPEHLALLQQGVDVWNAWRAKEPSVRPDLSSSDLTEAHLSGANLTGADLNGADLSEADLSEANLREVNLKGAKLQDANLERAHLNAAHLGAADLSGANLSEADLHNADLSGATLSWAMLSGAKFFAADLSGANLTTSFLTGTDLSNAHLFAANLSRAHLSGANLSYADLTRADLSGADLNGANLRAADLEGANLTEANLSEASLISSNLQGANLTGSRIYGISVWNVTVGEGTKQQNLIITAEGEPEVTLDNIQVAQFVYLLLHNEKIRDVIDTIGRKGVLLLGRFTEGRIVVLQRLREELRKRGYLPMVFNFDKPETKDFTETVRLLAGLSKFVIADITNPKSAPLELQATVPEIMVPFRPIIEEGEKPFAMLRDLWINHPDRVFEPIYYSSVDALIAALDEKIIKPAEARFVELVKRKAETMGGEHL